MEIWIQYALIAAVFISIKNVLSKKISGKYEYLDYIVYAVSISFIGIWSYVLLTGHKPAKVDNSDILLIIFRIAMVYLIIDPSIYQAYRHCKNPSKATSIINLDIVITFVLSVIFLNNNCDTNSMIGLGFITTGAFFIAYN